MFLYLYSPRGLMNIRTIGHQSRAIQGHSLGGSHSNWAGHKTFTDSCQLWELCFIWWDFKPRRQHLKWPWEGEGRGGARLYRSFATNAGCLNINRLLLMKENQIFQALEFSTFLCMQRYKSLGSMKSFLSYASQLSWASVLCFFFSHSELPWSSS